MSTPISSSEELVLDACVAAIGEGKSMQGMQVYALTVANHNNEGTADWQIMLYNAWTTAPAGKTSQDFLACIADFYNALTVGGESTDSVRARGRSGAF